MPRVAESGGRRVTEWSRFGDWGVSNYEDFLPPSAPCLGVGCAAGQGVVGWGELRLGRPDRSPLHRSYRGGTELEGGGVLA